METATSKCFPNALTSHLQVLNSQDIVTLCLTRWPYLPGFFTSFLLWVHVSKVWYPRIVSKWSTPRSLFIQVFVQLIYSKYIIDYNSIYLLGGFNLPLWKYKSVGMIIPIYYGTNKFMFQRTNQDWCNVKILAGNWLDFPMEKNIMFLSFYWFKVLQSKDDNVFPQQKKDLLRNPNVAKNQLQVRISLQKKSPIRRMTILNNHGFQFTLPWSTSMMWTFYITYILYIEYTLQ